MRGQFSDLKSRIYGRISASAPQAVWSIGDFADFGPRDAISKALQRLAAAGNLRRIDPGLYDRPRKNRLTGKPTPPDYRAVIDAIARRDQVRILIDGMTAANDLGLSDAVPGRVVVHANGGPFVRLQTRRRAAQRFKARPADFAGLDAGFSGRSATS